MKKLFIVVLAAIGMVSCMNTDEVIEVSNGDAIAFADAFIENSVRAAVDDTYNNDTNALEEFKVYGTVNAGGSVANIFNAVPVTNNGGVWSYDSQYTQYWVKGVTYDFAALVHGNAELDSDNMPVAINYDITNQEDLLYAEQKGVTNNSGEAKTVDFTFSHLLSKVKFTFENTITATDAYSYVVKDVKVEASKSATYDLENKTWGNYAEKTAVAFGGAEATLTSAAKAESQKEQLLIPSAESKKITFTLELMLGNVMLSSETKTVTTDVELEAGHAYNFTVVLGEPGEPIKFTATVQDWDQAGSIDLPFYDATTNTATVNSADGLQIIAEGIANGTYGEDINIVLGGDIDLSAITSRSIVSNWAPIGTEDEPFKGTFDGKGYTIKNLALVEPEAKEGKAFIGFFGYAKDATIKNVTFENVYINIPCLDIDHSQGHIGAVAGSLEGKSTIENVTVKGDIKVYATQDANGASRVAVVAGGNSYGDVTMKNVHVIANEGSYLIANNNTGALAGQLQGKNVFENCSSNIDVTVNKFFAGGLIGLAAGDSTFTNCHTTGDVKVVAGRDGRAHDQYRVGGIAGGWADGAKNVCTLIDCSYTGEISGKNSDGSVAEPLDYMGYVGRGYTLNGCQGSKVVIDGTEFVQKYNTAAQAGIYTINGCTPVSTAEELVAALKANEGVYFLNDIKIAATEGGYKKAGILQNKAQTIDGNGHTLTVTGAGETWSCAIYTNGGIIRNLTVAGAMRGIFTAGQSADLKIENVEFKNVVYTFNSDGDMPANPFGVYVSNSKVNGWTSHSDMHTEVVYTNCSFGEGSGYKYGRPYGKTSYVNCTFCAGYTLDKSKTKELTFTNCTWEE